MVSSRIKIGKKNVKANLIKLQDKNLIVLVGKKGFIMCGYLNLRVANKFGDVAVKITGVSTIKQALGTKVHSLSSAAKKLGMYKGQRIRDVLKSIA